MQLSAFAQSLSPAFASGDIHKVTAAMGGTEAATFMAVRGLLLSAALVAASGSSASLLPTHELNTLFRYREQLKATDEELYLILQALLADAADVNPGWYWLAAVPPEDLVIWIIRAISFDANSVARIAGVRVLRDGRISIPQPQRSISLSESCQASPTIPRPMFGLTLLKLRPTTTSGSCLQSRRDRSWVLG